MDREEQISNVIKNLGNSIGLKEKRVSMIEKILKDMEKESVFVKEYIALLDNKEVRQYINYLNYLNILENELSYDNEELDKLNNKRGR